MEQGTDSSQTSSKKESSSPKNTETPITASRKRRMKPNGLVISGGHKRLINPSPDAKLNLQTRVSQSPTLRPQTRSIEKTGMPDYVKASQDLTDAFVRLNKLPGIVSQGLDEKQLGFKVTSRKSEENASNNEG